MARDQFPGSPIPTTPDSSPDTDDVDSRISLRERAFALHCEGLRSPAIARRIGVPARTIRAWLRQDLADLARQQRAQRPERLALAVERHLAVAAAAWDTYHRAAAYDTLTLAALHAAVRDAQTDPEAALPLPTLPLPKPSAAAVRSLATVLAAQREVARLHGLHIYQEEPAKQGPQHIMLCGDEELVVRPDELEAWIAFRDAYPRPTDLPRHDDTHDQQHDDRHDDGDTSGDAAPSAPDATPGPMPGRDENAAEMAIPAIPAMPATLATLAPPATLSATPAHPSQDDTPLFAEDDADDDPDNVDADDEPPLFPADPDDPDDPDEVDLASMDWRERARAGHTLVPLAWRYGRQAAEDADPWDQATPEAATHEIPDPWDAAPDSRPSAPEAGVS